MEELQIKSYIRYANSVAGRACRRAARKTYNQTEAASEKRKEYYDANKRKLSQTRRTKYRHKKCYDEFAPESDIDEEDISLKRKEAMDTIRSHRVQCQDKLRFNVHKDIIKRDRKSVYLPQMPNASREGIFKTKTFTRSKSRLNYKGAVTNILLKRLVNKDVETLRRRWCPSIKFRGKSQNFKKLFMAGQLQRRILNARDKWVKVGYSIVHKINLTCERILNEDELDTSDRSYDRLLGWRNHRKGMEPHFPIYSFKDGQQFHFKYKTSSKKSRETLRDSEKCTSNCIPAGKLEVDRFREFLHQGKELKSVSFRDFIQEANRCGNSAPNEMYSLIVEKRNHPEGCYRTEAKNLCTSLLLLLRKLAVHYQDARTVYKLMNRLKTTHQFLSDIDAATVLGDVGYLTKLLNYKPPIVAKTFEVERNNDVINEETMAERYGDKVLEFFKATCGKAKITCVSCRRLVDDRPEKRKVITERWNKLRVPGSQYALLLQYLQSYEWVRKGGEHLDSLIGQYICNYCKGKMDKGEIPRISVRNNMDMGTVPNVIQDLTQIEWMFIRQVSMFQTVLKLGPSSGNRPSNEKMPAMKGFAVHIPVPIQMNIKQLAGEKLGLVNPRNFIVLHGLPSKDKKVWQSLINVDKVYAAIKWLVENNPLYKHIKVPSQGELLDMMCEFDSQDDGDVSASIGSGDSSIHLSVSDQMSSSNNDSNRGNPKKKRKTSPSSISASDNYDLSLPEVLSADKLSSSELLNNDENLEYLCNSSSDSTKENSVSSIDSLQDLGKPLKRRRLTGDRGGSFISNSIEATHMNIADLDVALQPECKDFEEMWQFSATVTAEDMDKVQKTADLSCKRKLVAVKCSISLAQKLESNNSLCKGCKQTIGSTKMFLISMLQYGKRAIGYQLMDQRVLCSGFEKLRAAIMREDISIKKNNCSLCTSRSIEPQLFKMKARRNHEGSLKGIKNAHEFQASHGAKFFYQTKLKILSIIDTMKENSQICCACYEEVDGKCQQKVSSYAKSSKLFSYSVRNKTAELYDTYCEVQGLSSKLRNYDQFENVCVKCENGIDNHMPHLIDHGNLAEAFKTSAAPKEEEKSGLNTSGGRIIGLSTTSDDKILCSSLGSPDDPEKMKQRKSQNVAITEDILWTLNTALRKRLHCSSCYDSLKATACAFQRILKYKRPKKTHQRLNIEKCDTSVLSNLREYYSARLLDSATQNYCLKCAKTLDLRGGGSTSDIFSDFSSISSLDSDEDRTDNIGSCSDEEKEEDPKKMMEQMSADDFKNLIEDYTVTGMDILDDNPELMDDLYKLLRIDDDPIDMADTNLDLLAFPEIFSWGVGGKRGFRGEQAKPLQYEKARLMSSNGSTRRHVQHLFHLAGECERRKIKSSIIATMKNVNGLGNLSAHALLQRIMNKDPTLLKNMNKVLRQVPNTQAYWEGQRARLNAQIEKFGPPTFFCTFSPADYDWDELIDYIKAANLDFPDIDKLSPSALINKDPVLASEYIHKRFDALLKFIIDAEPLGKVKSHYVRHEYQMKGTVHFHCFLWIEGAPIIGQSSDEEIARFIQKHITCRVPDPVEEETLFDVVTSYNSHKCRSYCLRTFKGSKKTSKDKSTGKETGRSKIACRFGFPRPKSKKFVMHKVLGSVIGRKSKRMRQRLYDLSRDEHERRINDYNPILSFLWKGNMDIQFLAEDSYSIVGYITKYITKCESSAINIDESDFKDISKSHFQNLSKFAFQMLKSREMGAHEAADRILQNKGELWRSSETFVWVPTTTPDRRNRVMRTLNDLKRQNPDSTNVFYDDWVHVFYPNRPRTPEFESMSLYDFVSKFEKTTGKPKEIDNTDKYVKLQDANGGYIRTIQRRKRDAVIYHHNYSHKTNPELFYYSMLMLYKPWRQEGDIAGLHTKYSEAYFDALEEFAQLREMSGKKIDIEKAKQKMEEEAEEEGGHDEDRPSTNQAPEDFVSNDVSNSANIRAGLKDFETINNKSSIRTQNELDAFVDTLNSDQRRIYDKIVSHVEHCITHNLNECKEKDCNLQPLFLFVSGFGGTGKSYLIKALQGYMWVQKHLLNKPADIALTAPTGLAAANIEGQTLHSLFALPVEHGEKIPKYAALKQSNILQTRTVMRDLALMVVDEISMVSAEMFLAVNLRLQEIFGPDELFGGRCLVVFGDLLQLPPVHGKRPFEPMSGDNVHVMTGGLRIPSHLWDSFLFDELTINQRQSGKENLAWSYLLSRMRVGRHTPQDLEVLRERLIPLQPSDVPRKYLQQIVDIYLKLQEEFPGTVCLLPKRAMMDAFNETVIVKRFPNAVEVMADDEVDGRTKADKKRANDAVKKIDKLGDSRNTADLEKKLVLNEGMRIILRRNLDTAKGLVNGAMGVIKQIINTDPTNVNSLKIMAQFDGVPGTISLLRETRKVKLYENCFLHRTQFPISSGYALTIHKAQGMSLSHVFCDIGRNVFTTGQIYVALSRCKTISGLHLVNLDGDRIKADHLALREYVRLGSKPIIQSGILSATEPAGSQSGKRKAKSQASCERIWYETSSAKKARSSFKDNLESSRKTTSKNAKNKNTKKKKASAKNNKDGRQVPTLTANNISLFINRIYEDIPPSFIPTTDIISGNELNEVYRRVLVPVSRRSAINRFMHRTAEELNPDPFLSRPPRSLWLSGSTINNYIAVLKDICAATGGPTIYNMGPYTSIYDPKSRGTLESYVGNTFSERPFTKRRLVL